MSDFRIVYEKDGGGVGVICPPPENKRKDMTDAEYVDYLVNKGDVPKGASFKVVDASDLPKDRYFREAWVPCEKAGVKIDLTLAKEVHRNIMRKHRAPLLAELDVKQLRGEDVEKDKELLRDITKHPSIDKVSTPEDLKNIWPEILGPKLKV